MQEVTVEVGPKLAVAEHGWDGLMAHLGTLVRSNTEVIERVRLSVVATTEDGEQQVLFEQDVMVGHA